MERHAEVRVGRFVNSELNPVEVGGGDADQNGNDSTDSIMHAPLTVANA